MLEDNHLEDNHNTIVRRSTWSLLAVWMGFIVVAGTMVAGGNLVQEYGFENVVIMTLLANLLLGGVAGYAGYIGAKTGKSFAQLSEFAFPGISQRIVNLYVPIILTFWFAVLASVLGQYLVGSFDALNEKTVIVSLILCFLLSLTSYFGIKYLSVLSAISVPLIICLAGYAVMSTPVPESTSNPNILNLSSLNIGLGVIVSTWIMGATLNIPDITRFARTAKLGAIIGFLGIVLGNSFNIIVGARAALIGGTADPSGLLLALGLPALGFLLVVTNLWTTNDNNMYSASIGLSEAAKVSRKKAVLILSCVAALLVTFEIGNVQTIMSGIIFMGATAPALAGVVLAGYLFQNKHPNNRYLMFPWHSWLAWFIGAALGLNVSGLVGLIFGTLASFLIQYTFSSILLYYSNKGQTIGDLND